jgi:hypothetical protein
MSLSNQVNKVSKQVIKVSGEKIESLLITDNALQLLSSSCATAEEFNATWTKSLTLATKTEILFDAIKSITKEEGEDNIVITSKGLAGMSKETQVTFDNPNDLDGFYSFFQNDKGFVRTDESLSPFKSAMPFVYGLLITLAVTGFGYYLSIQDEPTTESSGRAKGRFIMAIVRMLGTTGVLLLGFAISAYVAYMIWTRYKNPPVQTKLVPAG